MSTESFHYPKKISLYDTWPQPSEAQKTFHPELVPKSLPAPVFTMDGAVELPGGRNVYREYTMLPEKYRRYHIDGKQVSKREWELELAERWLRKEKVGASVNLMNLKALPPIIRYEAFLRQGLLLALINRRNRLKRRETELPSTTGQ